MVLYDLVRKGGQDNPDRPAIIFQETVISYGDLYRQTGRAAAGLRREGISAGDRVAILLPNCPQFTFTYFAAAALGAVAIPANPLLKAAELEHIWGDSDASVVVTALPLLPQTLEACAALPAVKRIVCVGPREAAPAGTLAYDDLLAASDGPPADLPVVDPESPAVFIYTSGTTGKPKGAILSHRNLIANCEQIRGALEFTPEDNLLCVLPLFHSFAGTVCQNAAFYTGAHMTVLETFHPSRVLEAVERHRVTIFPGVPAMYAALLQFPADRQYDFDSVRAAISGGAPMPVAIMQAFEKKFDTIILEGDGPTECGPCTSVNPPNGVRKPASVGLPLPGVEMRIIDANDAEAPVGEIGEIVVRGPNVMLGYHNQPEATADAMRGGWYHTGDLGRMDEDGYFFIVDRKKDMLIVGGINVYPREVEEVLFTHPAIADAAVIGAPDMLRGDEVVAVIVLKTDAQTSQRDVQLYCRERLANFKVPRRVLIRESLPRGGTGKVLKRLLRKELEMERPAEG